MGIGGGDEPIPVLTIEAPKPDKAGAVPLPVTPPSGAASMGWLARLLSRMRELDVDALFAGPELVPSQGHAADVRGEARVFVNSEGEPSPAIEPEQTPDHSPLLDRLSSERMAMLMVVALGGFVAWRSRRRRVAGDGLATTRSQDYGSEGAMA